ncbi:MAG: tripartite tricarboxylate transporter substrate-binding protein [Rubrivivax sp.]
MLVVNPAKGWRSVADLVAAAKAKPGAMNCASAGVGSATHFNAEKFRLQAGITAVHVPFKGTPEAMGDVVGGRSDWFFAPLSAALPLIREGRLQTLAVSSARRSAQLPDVPTTVEAGMPGSDYTFWVALVVPSATPAAAVARLQLEAAKALATRPNSSSAWRGSARGRCDTNRRLQRLPARRGRGGGAHRQGGGLEAAVTMRVCAGRMLAVFCCSTRVILPPGRVPARPAGYLSFAGPNESHQSKGPSTFCVPRCRAWLKISRYSVWSVAAWV